MNVKVNRYMKFNDLLGSGGSYYINKFTDFGICSLVG